MAIFLTAQATSDLANGAVTNLKFALGSSYGYIPGPGDTGVRGSVILQGSVSAPVVAGPSLYKYSISLNSADDISFGEIALLYANNSLFGLISYLEPIV